MDVAERPLKVALEFQVADHWTLGIYKVEVGNKGERHMRCVAQVRSVKCTIKDARLWPEGRGAGWIALANESNVVVPDVKSPAMGTIFEGMLKPEDFDRYRSVAAVPIILRSSRVKWGAVVATSDQEEHFTPEPTPGVRPLEGVRALAGMVELALAARSKASSAPSNPKGSSTVSLPASGVGQADSGVH